MRVITAHWVAARFQHFYQLLADFCLYVSSTILTEAVPNLTGLLIDRPSIDFIDHGSELDVAG